MFNWRKKTSDPCDKQTVEETIKYLNGIRSRLSMTENVELDDYMYLICELAKGKRVLDIGICEHTKERIQSSKWKHRQLVKYADFVLGIDIDADLVEYIKKLGFNAIVCDATSDIDLGGEKFDVVVIGDVIEHVENPIALLKFAKRHLSSNGMIVVRTTNPYCYSYICSVFRNGTDRSNLEHIAFITPTHAMELANRTGLSLKQYFTKRKKGRNFLFTLYKYIVKRAFLPDELYSTIFIYIFSNE